MQEWAALFSNCESARRKPSARRTLPTVCLRRSVGPSAASVLVIDARTRRVSLLDVVAPHHGRGTMDVAFRRAPGPRAKPQTHGVASTATTNAAVAAIADSHWRTAALLLHPRIHTTPSTTTTRGRNDDWRPEGRVWGGGTGGGSVQRHTAGRRHLGAFGKSSGLLGERAIRSNGERNGMFVPVSFLFAFFSVSPEIYAYLARKKRKGIKRENCK